MSTHGLTGPARASLGSIADPWYATHIGRRGFRDAVQVGLGKLTGDLATQAKGTAEKLRGKAQRTSQNDRRHRRPEAGKAAQSAYVPWLAEGHLGSAIGSAT